MKEFHPPIHTRETEELVVIAHASPEEWQHEAIDQAQAELRRRGITADEQQSILNIWRDAQAKKKIETEQRRALNKTENYSAKQMLMIVVSVPLIFLIRWKTDHSLVELWRENYKRKFWQRLILLLIGTSAWIALIWAIYIVYK